MNPKALQDAIVRAIVSARTDDWVPFTLGEFRNRLREFDKNAAEASIAAIAEACISLAQDGFLALGKREDGAKRVLFDFQKRFDAGYIAGIFAHGSFDLKLTHDGRQRAYDLEQRMGSTAGMDKQVADPLIFVSCGQSTPEERQLGKDIAALVERETGCKAYFAENQNSLEGVTENILKKLNEAVGFIAIMHPRGDVSNPSTPNDPHWARGSVWVEQEIAIAAFVSQALQRTLRVRAYVHKSIRREGLRDKLHLNPFLFQNDSEILADLQSVLPEWKTLISNSRKEPLSLRPIIKFERVPVPGGGAERYRLLVGVENDGELDAPDFRIVVDFPSAFLDEGAHAARVQSTKDGYARFQLDGASRGYHHFYPGEKTRDDFVSFHYAVRDILKREHPEALAATAIVTVYSGSMKPRTAVKRISELLS